MLDQEKILQFLQHTGPTIPTKVAKNIGSNILIASAHLSDLASQGKVRISDLKIGSSPLYYLPGQEGKLYQFASGNLNPKDFRVLEKLQQQQVLREDNLDVLSKLALRSLKDFAVPIHVTVGGRKQLFWRYHTLTDEETKEKIRTILTVPKTVIDKLSEKSPEQQPVSELPLESEIAKKVEPVKEPQVKVEPPQLKPTPVKIKKKVKRKEKQITLAKQPGKKEIKPEEIKKKPILQKIKEKIVGRPNDSFFPNLEDYCAGLDIRTLLDEVENEE